jgi:poly-gamma-glutamate capsule biosynthesis protein CapA/YwtB (metallophosphatase superfamily)
VGARPALALAAAAVIAACSGSAAPEARTEVWLGGDVHLGAGDALGGVGALAAGAWGIVNLEGPIGAGAAESSAERLVNGPAAPGALARAGVRVAGIANNHDDDLGPGGAAVTARALRAAGIAPAGGREGAAVIADGGVRVVVTAHDLTGGVPAGLDAELAAARRLGDVLVATFHVTGPPSYLPRPELVEAVDIALAAGARVVVSHGTHVLARVERRGEAVIAWGLGNLVFACDCTQDQDGLILRVTLGRDGVEAAVAIPIDAGLGGDPARPAADRALAFELLEALGSSPIRRDGDRAWF